MNDWKCSWYTNFTMARFRPMCECPVLISDMNCFTEKAKIMEFHGTVQEVIFVHIVFHLYRNHQGQIIVVTRGQDPSPHSKGWPISTNYKYFFRAHYSCAGYAEQATCVLIVLPITALFCAGEPAYPVWSVQTQISLYIWGFSSSLRVMAAHLSVCM